jgi:hypothetical protein
MMAWLTLILKLSEDPAKAAPGLRKELIEALGAMPGTDDKGEWSA